MQPGNMDAHHQMRLLFGQMDNPMMMPMQMPFLIPATTSTATTATSSAKTSDKEKDKDKTKTLDPVTLPGYAMPGMSPYPYGMFPYGAGVSPMQMPLMLPLGASPFMPYNLFPYPGMLNPKDAETKSGTALLKELSNNSKKAQGGKNSPGPTKGTPNKHGSLFDRGSESKKRNSPLPKPSSDAKKFSDIVQSAIMDGFKETEKEKRKEKDKHKHSRTHDAPLDFSTKARASPVREPPRKVKERPRHDEYLHLLQKTSLHHKHDRQVREKEKPNTAKLKIEALIDFGQKKPTLSNLKLNLEKELEENIKASTFSAGSERYNFSPDSTFRGEERKTWAHSDSKVRREQNQSHTFQKADHYKSQQFSKKLSRDMGLYPGEIQKQFGDGLPLSLERDFEDSDVLRGEAHQVRLARYNAQRLRMNSFYKSDNYTYVEQVEPDSTGDLNDEPGEISPKLKTEHSDQKQKSKSSPSNEELPMTGLAPKRQRIESPLARSNQHGSSLQDLKVDSSDIATERTDPSPPGKDSTVRDKILSYIKSRSKRKRDMSPIPPLMPDMPVQDLKLQPGLSIVDSWKHQLAPSVEATAQATLEEMVLQHWRQSLANDYYQNSAFAKNLREAPESAVGSFDNAAKSDKAISKEDFDLEPGEVYRPCVLNIPQQRGSPSSKDSHTPSPCYPSTLNLGHDKHPCSEPKTESPKPTPVVTETVSIVTVPEKPASGCSSNVSKKEVKRKADSPFSISDIMGNLGRPVPNVSEKPTPEMQEPIEDTQCSNTTPSEIKAVTCTDNLSSTENQSGSSSEAEKDPVALSLSPKPCVSLYDSDRSDSSHKSKKQRRDDDANTVSAEFALEAVKALDCFANLTSTMSDAAAMPNSTTQGQGDTNQKEIITSTSSANAIGHFSDPSVKKLNKKIKRRRKKFKSLSRKNLLNKQMQPPGDPDANMSVLACTDISNVNITKDLAFAGLFSAKARPGRPSNGSVQYRGRGRPPKSSSSGFSFGEKRRKPGRPPKVKSDSMTPGLSSSTASSGNGAVTDSSSLAVEQPQRKKRSPLFYGCNYNDTLLISALRIKLPKSEKKLKKKGPKRVTSANHREEANAVSNVKESNCSEPKAESRDLARTDILENVALSTLRQTKECSVLLKDVSSYLSEEKNMNVKESPLPERTESEKENKEESSSGDTSRCESPVRVFSRPQVAKRSKPWSSQHLAGNRLVLRRDPSKNGYFVKYSDVLREESEKLGPSEISSDVINTVVNSVVCAPLVTDSKDGQSVEPQGKCSSTSNGCSTLDSLDEVFESVLHPVDDDSECGKCEPLDIEKKPSLVDRFKATLLNEVNGVKRRGIQQRSRSTDDLMSIKSKKKSVKQAKKPPSSSFDLYKNGSPSSPSKREERVSALKEKLKLQQAAVAEIQWKMLESGAQSE